MRVVTTTPCLRAACSKNSKRSFSLLVGCVPADGQPNKVTNADKGAHDKSGFVGCGLLGCWAGRGHTTLRTDDVVWGSLGQFLEGEC